MRRDTEQMLAQFNSSAMKIQGAYTAWAKENQVNYHELLVLYSLDVFGARTQKQICEQYLVPKQTVYNIVSELRRRGYVALRKSEESWREKVMELTASGQAYARSVMDSLMKAEAFAVQKMGVENLRVMTDLVSRYGLILEEGLRKREEPLDA